MGLNPEYTQGQTPLEEEKKQGLRITTIATRAELDEFEQQNIEQAILWTVNNAFKPEYIFTEEFVKKLHQRMYADVWQWAGKFRNTNKNIGVDRWRITTELHNLLTDAAFWLQHNTYSADETAIRFKHRLVAIHCFANGNGRHSRLMADVIATHLFKLPPFTWGKNLPPSQARSIYIAGLKTADTGNIQPLLQFARQ